MIIIRDGVTIVESGDPDFASVQDLGPAEPTNYILDPDPDKPVTQFVLEAFDIPFNPSVTRGRILGGVLPGFDIRNQDATTTLKLSLAVELRNNILPGSADLAGVGEFAEVELDEYGIARFFIVGEEPATDIDVRYCIPTSQIKNPADLVIVRGYDPPPTRELRTTFDGLKNAEIYEYEECAAGSCDEKAVGNYASISYDDPLLDQVYLDDVVNSYELVAFESLIGYVVDLDLPSGVDPDEVEDYVKGVKITFGDTTKEYITMDAALLNNFVDAGTTAPWFSSLFDKPSGGYDQEGGKATGRVTYGSSANGNETTLPFQPIEPRGPDCAEVNASLTGSKITIPATRFKRLNKYGFEESDFAQVSDVVFSGRKITKVTVLSQNTVGIYVKAQRELISLDQGKNWTWTVDEDGNVEIELLATLEDDYGAYIAGIYAGKFLNPDVAFFRYNIANPGLPEAQGEAATEGLIAAIGDRLGYLAVNNRLCVVVERKRPTLDIFDPNGGAGAIARKFLNFIPDPNRPGEQMREYGVRYTPIVIVDEPAPIAYAATAPLQSIDNQSGQPGSTVLPANGIIDQADGIIDADPSTVQDPSESETQVLQDNTSGATIDITLPFCTGPECLEIAQNFLALQLAETTTQSMILGPLSEPKLGQFLTDGSIINEINYSYSDSSQYLITVTAGPKYLSAGSFQDSQYQLKTEDITREGTVTQDLGNGAEYTVRIEGFGELQALSMILDEISVGDKVNVRLYNNPQEKT